MTLRLEGTELLESLFSSAKVLFIPRMGIGLGGRWQLQGGTHQLKKNVKTCFSSLETEHLALLVFEQPLSTGQERGSAASLTQDALQHP